MLRCNFTVIKYRHSAVRNELVNVGVAVWKKDGSDFVIRVDESLRRVRMLFPSAQLTAVQDALGALRRAATKRPESIVSMVGPTGSLVLTPAHATLCESLEGEADDLFSTYLESEAEAAEDEDELDEEPVKRQVRHRSHKLLKGMISRQFEKLGIQNAFKSAEARKLQTVKCRSGVPHRFDYAFQNGTAHRIQIVSLDVAQTSDLISRARSVSNLLSDVQVPKSDVVEVLIQPPMSSLLNEAWTHARLLLNKANDSPFVLKARHVRTDGDIEAFCAETQRELEHRSM